MARSRVRTGGAVLLLAALAILAHGAHAQTPRDTTSTRTAPRDTTSRGKSTVPADSLPSDDARAVLRGIPEPIAPEEQVEPADSLLRESERAAAPDTAASESDGVPVPAETAPLGERPGGTRAAVPDSMSAPPAAAPGSAVPAGTGPGSGAAVPDTCWRVQLAAPAISEEAAAKRAAAESQLLVPMAIEVEQGRHKVRSRECLTRPAADALKARALLSGFADAFLIRMGADGRAISASPPRPAPAKKPAGKPSGARRSASGR